MGLVKNSKCIRRYVGKSDSLKHFFCLEETIADPKSNAIEKARRIAVQRKQIVSICYVPALLALLIA